jgi:pyruvate/2-oxoglutarate dehydrogenase complex dihydrolipoamide acyltransferase (E2) component
VSEDRMPRNTAEAEAVVRPERDDGAPTNGETPPATEEPDVFLHVPELEVDRITLEVDDLRAHVSVLAELANLVSLSVGADARLGQVKLEIEGVEAQVLLKVRLEHVRAILEKALDTIGEHPEILRILSRTLSELLKEALEDARAGLDNVLEELEVGDTVDELLKGRLEDIRTGLEEALERHGENGGPGGALREGAQTVQRVVDESGSVVEQTLTKSGEVAEEVLRTEAEETQNKVQATPAATPAAEREAQELGVELSTVEGTGAQGRITVTDVRRAAQRG